jgi:hypothetical protein
MVTSFWAPKVLYLWLWRVVARAPPLLEQDLPLERSEPGFYKINLAQIFLIRILPCRHHISLVWTTNNANSVSRLCATKLSSDLVLMAFLGNEEIPK